MAHRSVVKSQLQRLLDATEGAVLALNGPWGAGKSHLWHELVASEVYAKHSIVSVSLYGIGSISDLRVALITEAFARSKKAQLVPQKLRDQLKQHAPAILQVLDDKIGAPVLARIVDPTVLLPPGSIICLDDVERKTQSLGLADVLGFATLLAERRRCKVLLIYNDDHIEQTSTEAEQIRRAYRERTISQAIRLSPDLNEVGRIFLGSMNHRLTADDYELVMSTLRRANSANLRTLKRALVRGDGVRRVLGDRALPEHIALAVALTVEDDEGKLQPSSFYRFDPIAFLFVPDNQPLSEQDRARLEFYQRHYDASSTAYRFCAAIYDYVTEGVLDPQALWNDVRPLEDAEQPLLKLLKTLETREFLYLSDSEYEAWISNALSTIDSKPANAGRLFLLHQGVQFAYARLGRSDQAGVDLNTIASAIIERGGKGDASLDLDQRHFHDSGTQVHALFDSYEVALSNAQNRATVEALIHAVESGNLSDLQNLLHNRPSRVLLVLDGEPLRRLSAQRTANKRFYFEALHYLRRACELPDAPTTAIRRLREYVSECLSEPTIERSDAHRYSQIRIEPGAAETSSSPGRPTAP